MSQAPIALWALGFDQRIITRNLLHAEQLVFKQSSQHLDRGNGDDYSKAPLGSIWASSVAVAGTASGGATGELSTGLGIDCCGSFE
jgi:hypothetical protein